MFEHFIAADIVFQNSLKRRHEAEFMSSNYHLYWFPWKGEGWEKLPHLGHMHFIREAVIGILPVSIKVPFQSPTTNEPRLQQV